MSFRSSTVYLIHSFVFEFAFMLAATLNLVWQASAGLTALQLVLIGTTLELTVVLGEIPTGVVADTYSRRLSVIIGVFLYAVGWLIEGAFPIFWTFLLAQVLWGTGWTFISGARAAWIADEVGEANAGPIYLRGAQMSQLGILLAIPLAAVLGSVQLNLPILVGAFTFLALGIVLVLAMPEEHFKPAAREDRGTFAQMWHTFRGGVGVVRGQPVLVTILAIGAFFGMSSEGFDRLWTPHLLSMELPPIQPLQPVAWFAVIGFAEALLALAATEWLARRLDTADHRRTSTALLLLTIGQIVASLAFALIVGFWGAIVAWLALRGVFRAAIEPVYYAWLNQGIDSRFRATVLSMRGQVDAIGQVVGGPLLGLIATLVSIPAALVVGAIVLLPALPLFARARRQERGVRQAP